MEEQREKKELYPKEEEVKNRGIVYGFDFISWTFPDRPFSFKLRLRMQSSKNSKKQSTELKQKLSAEIEVQIEL